jgi:magnesium-transporting ATPase (P-type)
VDKCQDPKPGIALCVVDLFGRPTGDKSQDLWHSRLRVEAVKMERMGPSPGHPKSTLAYVPEARASSNLKVAAGLLPRAPEAVVSQGLSSADAAERLAADGPNTLPGARHVPAWRRFSNQLVHFFALMLWIAGILAVVAGMPQLGIAIFVVILVNGSFAFAQEFRAERAADRLKDLLPQRAVVVRDGQRIEIAANDLVADDLVVLRSGDRISADMKVVSAARLAVDTSMLTGESAAVTVGEGEELFAGCFVTGGEGTATVSATGARTRLASIAELTQKGQRPRSPLEHELNRVVRTIAFIATGVGIAFFGIALLVGGSPRNGFLFAVGVTVALVPEGLLPTVTLSLAAGAQEMAKRHALVRHLESVETLGSTTYICSDKTGTITRNQMSVVEVWTPRGTAHVTGIGYEPTGVSEVSPEARPQLGELARVASRCSADRAVYRDGRWMPDGDPMETRWRLPSMR